MDRKLFNALFSRPIAFHRIFAEITGNVTTGLFLSQLFYWHDKGSDLDGWIYKTYAEWKEETTMTRREIDLARKILKSMKILQEKKEGVPAKLFYRIDIDTLSEAIKGTIKPLSLDELLAIYDSHLLELSKTGLMRAKKAGVENEFVDYRELLKQKGMTCGICQELIVMRPGQAGGCLTFDHIIPVCKGGSHTFDNIQPAHAYCNAAKSGKDDSSSLSSVSKLDCLAKANCNAYPKQTNLYTENTSEITSSSEDGQERDFEAIALAEKAAYLAKQKLAEEVVRKRQRNFYQDAIWGVLAKKTDKDPKSVFEAFKSHVENHAKKSGKSDPVKWAEAVIHKLFEVEGSEANNSLWQEFEAIALGKIKPLEENVRGRNDLSAAPPAAPEPSQAARERLKQLRGGVA